MYDRPCRSAGGRFVDVDSGVAGILVWFIGSSSRRLAGFRFGTAIAETIAGTTSSTKVDELECMTAGLILHRDWDLIQY